MALRQAQRPGQYQVFMHFDRLSDRDFARNKGTSTGSVTEIESEFSQHTAYRAHVAPSEKVDMHHQRV